MATIRDVAEGLQILQSEGATEICAEHDVIYAGHGATDLRDASKKALEELGWRWDDSADSWAHFV